METTSVGETYGPMIEQIVENVFQTMMGLEVHALEGPTPVHEQLVTGSISLTGAWRGAVLVECPLEEAFFLTSRMVGVPLPSDLTDDVRDAVGELANMVGGNLKSVLPAGVALSLPSVVSGSNYRLVFPYAKKIRRWVFAGPGVTFRVILVEVGEGVCQAETGQARREA